MENYLLRKTDVLHPSDYPVLLKNDIESLKKKPKILGYLLQTRDTQPDRILLKDKLLSLINSGELKYWPNQNNVEIIDAKGTKIDGIDYKGYFGYLEQIDEAKAE